MSLREDFDNKIIYPETDKEDEYFDAVIKVEGYLSDDLYNEFEGEIRDLLNRYNLEFSGV